MAYRHQGSEILVNTTTAGDQIGPKITRLSSGGYVVVWLNGSGGARGQVFEADGDKIGAEFVTAGWHVAALSGGGFAAMSGDGQDVFVQIHNAAGAPVGSAFKANTTSGNQNAGSIASLESGGFVVTWSDFSDPSDGDVRAQLFAANGSKVGTEFVVNNDSVAPGSQMDSEATGLAGGGFVVTWESEGAIRGQAFTAAGAKTGSEFAVSSETDFMEDPQIAALSSGGFVVVWTRNTSMTGPETYQGIYAQVFSASGARVGPERLIAAEGPGSLESLDVAALATGGFVVTWASEFGTGADTSGTAIKAQQLDNLGNEVGGELIVNRTTSGDQIQPVVTGLPSGDFVIAWADGSETGGDTDGFAIRSQLFHNAAAIEGTAGDDRLYGTNRDDTMLGHAGDDAMAGYGGNDTLDGGTGGDYMEGGLGNDVYLVDDWCDTVEEYCDEGIDEVRTALGTRDRLYVLPDHVENLTGTASGAQAVWANGLDNVVVMGAGNDLIVLSDGGDDTVSSGAGNDFFYYGTEWTSADRTDGGAGTDTIGLIGSTTITLAEGSMTGVERLAMYTDAGTADYVITTVEANVLAGAQMFVTAASLQAGETLTFDGSAETDGGFVVHGGAGNDRISGGWSSDFIIGNAGDDSLYGLGGNDILIGGLGGDRMRGGGGADVFRYQSSDQSTWHSEDHILDFRHSDRIDLSAIDGNADAAGNNAFTFIGAAEFSNTAGELRAYQYGGSWWVEGDSDGDGTAELVLQVTLADPAPLGAGDFIL